ncbi:hypothetical protein [Spirillospora sp. CA-294931]|uniref:hypothetical protein n=1 Tax=Spirillospora sp. CA-294931 TaxID=3240042 RepID=UPI003D8AD375
MRIMLDADMPLKDVAQIFEDQDWEYGGPDRYGIPTNDDLATQIGRLAAEMENRDLDYLHSGRIALVRDPEVDGTFQVLLTVGYLYINGGPEEEDW